jgi:hypothetical protein
MPVLQAVAWQQFSQQRMTPAQAGAWQSCMQLFGSAFLTAHDPSTGPSMQFLHLNGSIYLQAMAPAHAGAAHAAVV